METATPPVLRAIRWIVRGDALAEGVGDSGRFYQVKIASRFAGTLALTVGFPSGSEVLAIVPTVQAGIEEATRFERIFS